MDAAHEEFERRRGWAGVDQDEVMQASASVQGQMPIPAQDVSNKQRRRPSLGKWIKGIFGLVMIVLLVAVVVSYQQGLVRVPYNLPLIEIGTEDKTDLEKYVDSTAEREKIIAQMKNSCEARNMENVECVSFVFDEERESCNPERVFPCCNNNICEQGEVLTCAEDCRADLAASASAGLLNVKYDSSRQGYTKVAQTFRVDEALELRRVKPSIEYALGSGVGLLEIFELDDEESPEGTPAARTMEFELEALPRGGEEEIVVFPPLDLNPGALYSLVISHKIRNGVIAVDRSNGGSLNGTAWLYQPLRPDEVGYFTDWQRIDGQMAVSLELVKRELGEEESEGSESGESLSL